LRQQQGLVVVVVVDSDSMIILANGNAWGCDDLVAGASASVRGVGVGS
jgi:hypothetical protein